MKKILSLVIAIAFAFSLTACGNPTFPSETTKQWDGEFGDGTVASLRIHEDGEITIQSEDFVDPIVGTATKIENDYTDVNNGTWDVYALISFDDENAEKIGAESAELRYCEDTLNNNNYVELYLNGYENYAGWETNEYFVSQTMEE